MNGRRNPGGGGKPCAPIISTTATIATNWQDGTRTTCSDQRPKVTRGPKMAVKDNNADAIWHNPRVPGSLAMTWREGCVLGAYQDDLFFA